MKMKMRALLAVCALSASAWAWGAEAKTYKMYLSMSYIGNDWQAEAANMVKAMAASKLMKDKVTLGCRSRVPTRNGKSNRSTPWFRREPTPSWSIRSRQWR